MTVPLRIFFIGGLTAGIILCFPLLWLGWQTR